MCKQHFTKVRITEILMPIQVLQDEKDLTCWFILYLKTSYWFLVMKVILHSGLKWGGRGGFVPIGQKSIQTPSKSHF